MAEKYLRRTSLQLDQYSESRGRQKVLEMRSLSKIRCCVSLSVSSVRLENDRQL